MSTNPNPTQSPPPPPPLPPTAVCGNCGADEGRLLHHVRHRGLFRRLCTTCVLRLHPQSFCPSCFSLFPLPLLPPSSETVSCSKCYSSTHPHCLLATSSSSPYLCPLCRNPSLPIFRPDKAFDSPSGFSKKIDGTAARMLLAAAKIASLSMGKAAVAARAEAERRAREAAVTRKRARDALEHVATLVGRDRERERPRRRENVGEVSERLNAVGLREREVGTSNGLQVHTQENVAGEGNVGPQ